MAGIVHFANFFRFMEETEHEFYRSLGFAGHFSGPRGTLGWPRLSARCDYRKPLRFEDVVEVHLLVRAKEEKSLLLDFIFRKQLEDGLRVVAAGALKVVCVRVCEEDGPDVLHPHPAGNLRPDRSRSAPPAGEPLNLMEAPGPEAIRKRQREKLQRLLETVLASNPFLPGEAERDTADRDGPGLPRVSPPDSVHREAGAPGGPDPQSSLRPQPELPAASLHPFQPDQRQPGRTVALPGHRRDLGKDAGVLEDRLPDVGGEARGPHLLRLLLRALPRFLDRLRRGAGPGDTLYSGRRPEQPGTPASRSGQPGGRPLRHADLCPAPGRGRRGKTASR